MSLLTQVKIQFSTKFTYFLFPPQALQQHFFFPFQHRISLQHPLSGSPQKSSSSFSFLCWFAGEQREDLGGAQIGWLFSSLMLGWIQPQHIPPREQKRRKKKTQTLQDFQMPRPMILNCCRSPREPRGTFISPLSSRPWRSARQLT